MEHTRKRSIFEKAVKSRLVEECLLDLFSAGKLHGTVHTCIGQELSGAVITEFLRPGDTIFSNHRCHGHFISHNDDIEGLIAELMGRKTGVSGGLGGSQHLYKDGFYSNGIQGGIVPVAAGLALGHKLREKGDISVVFIGDGSLGEGVIYEAFNLASKWGLPLLVVLEDNKYSQSTEQGETLAGKIDARAAAFGIETVHGDTWDWPRLYETVGDEIERMRLDGRPRFVHIETYRLKAHSKGDDTRTRDVVAPFELRDPVNGFLGALEAEDAAWVEAVRTRIANAVLLADNAPAAELPALPQRSVAPVNWVAAETPERTRMVGELNKAFGALMSEHDGMIMIGEDILSPYGGAFKATAGLSDAFPGRVLNTPISEACIVGMGAGLGLMGYYPVVEIMFGDFIGLAFDQIVNHAAKFHQMYNGQVTTNLIVRTPMGGGRGYGPTHSQTLDRHFLGVPGLRIVAMNSLSRPEQFYRPLIAPDSGPTLVIENKLLYGSYLRAEPPAGFETLRMDEAFGTRWIRPAALCDVTLIGYGGTAEMMIAACDTLFEEHDVVAQVLVVEQIYPFDVTPLIDVISAAPNLVIVEEGQGFAGFGAEIISQLGEADALGGLTVRRVSPPEHCIPSSGPLEKQVLPSVSTVVDTTLRIVRS